MGSPIKFVMMAAAVLTVAVSCNRGKEESQEGEALHFVIRAGSPTTRTFITNNGDGTYTPSWNAGDALGVYFTNVSGTPTQFVNAEVAEIAEFTPSGAIAGISGTQTLYAFYPLGAFNATATGKSISVNVKTEQTPDAVTTFDKSVDLLVARPYTGAIEQGGTVDLSFARILSVVKVTPIDGTTVDPVTHQSALSGECVKSVQISYDGSGNDAPLAGDVILDLDSGEFGSWTTKSYSVSAGFADNAFTLNGNNAAYLLANPVSIAAGKKVTFTIRTTQHVITKEITLAQKLEFPAGNIATISLTINNGWTIDDKITVENAIIAGTLTTTPTNVSNEWEGWNVNDEPEPEPDPNRTYKSVVILGIDGLGRFAQNTSTPNLDRIFSERGTYTNYAQSCYPTISAQNWGAILHGVPPEAIRLTNNIVEHTPYPVDSPYPSIFKIIRQAKPDADLACITTWTGITLGMVEEGIGVYKDTPTGSSSAAIDPIVANDVVSYLATHDPTLLFICFDQVDAAGHSYGYESSNYYSAIRSVDTLVGQVYDALKAKSNWDDTLLILVTDHGGLGYGHGDDDDARERDILFGVSGRTVDRVNAIVDAQTQDVASIALYALGLDIPDYFTSRIPTGVFEGVTGNTRNTLELPVPTQIRNHQTEATPAVSSMQSLLSGHNVMAYIPFDGSSSNKLGNMYVYDTGGTLSYPDGYFGQGVKLSNGSSWGYVRMGGVTVGTSSFSVAFWIKVTRDPLIGYEPCILCNKNWGSGVNKGFCIALTDWGIEYNVGSRPPGANSPSDYQNFATYMRPGRVDGWSHVVVVVDRSANKIRFYQDFAFDAEIPLDSSLWNTSFETDYWTTIGRDGPGNSGRNLPAIIDELIVTKDVLTASDVAAMKTYYHQ